MSLRRWTSEADNELRDMVAAGMGYPAIAAAVGRTVTAVRQRGCDLGLRIAPHVVLAQNVAAAHKRSNDPAYKAAHRAGCLTRTRDPEFVEKLRANMRKTRAAYLYDPEIKARRCAAIAGGVGARNEKNMAWCPTAHRTEYLRLVRMKGVTAADARRMVEDDIALFNARLVAAMTPFERLLERARRGEVKLIDLDVIQPWKAPLRERDGLEA